MKLIVVGPAVLPSRAEVEHKMRFFLRSCKRWGVEPFLYGIGTTSFPGYQALKVDLAIKALESVSKYYTHCLITDTWDCVFTGPIDEIIAKYVLMGSPPHLVSAFHQLGNVSDEEKQYPGVFKHDAFYCYPQVGGALGEVPLVIDTLRRMKKEYSKYNDDCFAWYDSIRDGWWKPTLDANCNIFQVRNEENVEVLDGGRIRNTRTGSTPCLWHICGGFTSQTTGTDERMTPIAEMLGLL